MRDKISTNAPYPSDSNEEQKPLPTEVLMNSESRPTSRPTPHSTSHPNERIVCYSEPEIYSGYNDSCLTLWTLQVIVAVTILACVVEGIHLGLRWFYGCSADSAEDMNSSEKALRLPGGERLLLAVPTQVSNEKNEISSPGAEKKIRAYEATRYFVVKGSSGRREFIAYDSDDDDEANRPVM